MSDTIAKISRTTQAHCAQLCEKQTLELGIAYYAPRFPDSPEVNQYREIIATAPSQFAAAWQEANTCFKEAGLTCRRMAMAANTATEAFQQFLEEYDFVTEQSAALTLTSWGPLSVDDRVRILPARAMRPALKATYVESPEPERGYPHALRAEIANERMDDAAYDMEVALVDGQPAGRCAMYQVGDIGRIMDLYALPGEWSATVRESLLAHSLALAKRLNMRNICAQTPLEAEDDMELMRRGGFEADGIITEFVRMTDAPSSPA